jgi:hypothetical protein
MIMQRLQLGQLTRSLIAYAAVSAVTVDTWLLLADRWQVIKVPARWYFDGPLLSLAIVGLPATISLGERVLHQIYKKPGQIVTVDASTNTPNTIARAIPFTINGRRSTLLANLTPSIFGETELPPGKVERLVYWRVPVQTAHGENLFTVHEAELRDFLEVAHRRQRHQFSRRYWCKRRRPPLLRPKYEAFMRLLTETGLVEGRHEHGRASGRLVTFPREALMFLKYQSRYAVSG